LTFGAEFLGAQLQIKRVTLNPHALSPIMIGATVSFILRRISTLVRLVIDSGGCRLRAAAPLKCREEVAFYAGVVMPGFRRIRCPD
jgi:hypothetical protein